MKATRLRTEYLENPIGIDMAKPRLFWNCEGGEKQTAYYGDFIGCPPIYLWASTAEILRDDSVKLYEKLRKARHSCNLYLRNGMMHTWMIVPYFPESQKDLKRLKAHLEDAFSGKFLLEDDIVRLK